MFFRPIIIIVSLIIATSTYANNTVIVTETVPGANCSCIAQDGCANLQTRKYKCTTTSQNITDKNFSVDLSTMDPLPTNNIRTSTSFPPLSNPNREIANFLNLIIFGGIFFYLTPTMIVLFSKNRAHRPSTILINIFLGWSVLGWFLALFLALQSSVVQVQVVENKL